MQIEDWLDDLGEFAAPVVAVAVKEWRQGEFGRKRPTPSDIRLLCLAEQRKRQPVADRMRVTDQRDEPLPPDDTVRQGWQKIPFPRLTAAEQALFRENVERRAGEVAGIGRGVLVDLGAAVKDR